MFFHTTNLTSVMANLNSYSTNYPEELVIRSIEIEVAYFKKALILLIM